MSMIGKTLGSFECTALLGKGGMGEVYKAKDQRLGRDVAIKVLPEEFAKDVDRVARFQREAKLLASLNHPNIASIYGLEESDGTHFLVLELIEGDTIADRLKHGAIPVEESLKLGLQIAEALEAAHEKGVIHRDLKPANIKVTSDGKVKVLDFGLAKAFAGDQEDLDLSNSPTLSVAATQQGVILGTAAYMSPEQAKGKAVDRRTDVWAFGCVLFEMLTGRSVFAADDVSQTLARVLEREPNFSTLPPNLHPRIHFLLERCLKKEVKNRYSGISDARVEIQEVLADPSGIIMQTVTATKARKRLRVGISWLAAAVVVTAAIAALAGWYLKPPEPRQVMRFDYDLPKSQDFSGRGYNPLAISDDGTKIVYVANDQLYLKNFNELNARPIQGTDEDPIWPFISPDGQWVGYLARVDNQLKKIAVMGGAPETLCEGIAVVGATWGTDDMVVFGTQGGIMRVSANGGDPEEIIKGKENEWFIRPQILPDGRSVLFTIFAGDRPEVAVQPLESEERKKLFAGQFVRYLPTGHLVYGLGSNLRAVPFDLDTLEVSGGPVSLVEGIFRLIATSMITSAISDSGTLVYVPGATLFESEVRRTLVWVDREGNEQLIPAEPSDYSDPSISPDGKKVALEVNDGTNPRTILVWDLVRESMMRLTLDEAENANPIWTPDGKRIVFWSNREGNIDLYWKAASGIGEAELLASGQGRPLSPSSFSSDGKTLLTRAGGIANYDIAMLSIDGEIEIKMLLQKEYYESRPRLSPDGRWMAYQSNESGQPEIYVRPFPEVDKDRWMISTNGGANPLWSPDGRELYYRNIDDVVMAVAVETDPAFGYGIPESLFLDQYDDDWDIHPDGKRFLMIKPPATTDDESTAGSPRKINVVVNWFDELKERVPGP